MTRNVTLRMKEELLNKLEHKAVDARMSLSAWITAKLEDLFPMDDRFENARTRSLARLERGFHLGGRRMTRDELHTR
jgi:hypothetical protein